MKVLWVTNLVFPQITEELHLPTISSGGWLFHFADLLSTQEEMNLGIVSIYQGNRMKRIVHNKITFFLLPISNYEKLFGSRKMEHYMKIIEQIFSPELIHIHGTELPLGLSFIEYFKKKKIVVNIQTLVSRIAEESNGGIKKFELYRFLSLRECLALKTPVLRQVYERMRCNNERKYLSSVKYVIGSTSWDKAYVTNLYPNINYYSCQYLFREKFYSAKKWSIGRVEKHSILTGQATAPLKGLHVLLKALYYVKKEVNDVKLYIPGPDLLSEQFRKNYSYGNYIGSLIKKYDLVHNVIFTGNLKEEEMVERMRKSQMVIVPSAIELGSSVLCEAMLLGVPVIASYRGGMTEKFEHGRSGFYYDYPEVFLLANYIKKLISDQDLAIEFSKNEIEIAEREHGQEKCVKAFCQTYKQILCNEN